MKAHIQPRLTGVEAAVAKAADGQTREVCAKPACRDEPAEGLSGGVRRRKNERQDGGRKSVPPPGGR